MQSSSLPSRPSFTADLQPVLVGAALSYDIMDGVIDQVVHSAMELAAVAHVTKLASPVTGPCMPLSEEDEWIENMLDNITKLEVRRQVRRHVQVRLRRPSHLFCRGSNSGICQSQVFVLYMVVRRIPCFTQNAQKGTRTCHAGEDKP